jgi:CheY-like chemotaxis protein
MSNPENLPKLAKSSPPLIYVVDDEPMLLELTAAILEPQGYRVQCFSDAVSALYHFSEANPKPDLVITDYAMPGMNGQELISGCRTANPDQKILLVSGTVDESIFAGQPVQPDLFLAKPYRQDQLTAAVSRFAPRPKIGI